MGVEAPPPKKGGLGGFKYNAGGDEVRVAFLVAGVLDVHSSLFSEQ